MLFPFWLFLLRFKGISIFEIEVYLLIDKTSFRKEILSCVT